MVSRVSCAWPEELTLPPTTPTVIFLPGLRGHSRDLPGASQIYAVRAEGWRACVFNRRGHTRGRQLMAPRFNIFGDAEETELLVDWLMERRFL